MSAPSGNTTQSQGRSPRSQRVRRRLPCSFVVDDQTYRGITINLAADGVFIQTEATASPGCEIEIELKQSGSTPLIRLRGVVARRRAVPALLASAIQRGIGVRILEAPPEYARLFEEARPATPLGRHDRAPSPLPALGDEAPAARPTSRESALTLRARPEAIVEIPYTPATTHPEVARPDVLVIDDGSLGDLAAVLEEIGAKGLRLRTTRGRSPSAWIRPRRLLVTSAPLALSFPWPERCGEDGFVAIAMADDASQTLSAQSARLGFRHLVSRSLHPQALRILLRNALYGGRERRRVRRFAFECAVSLSCGWGRSDATLVELSAEGCRLVSTRVPLKPAATVRITLASGSGGRRGPSLRARVIRRDPLALPNRDPQLTLALVFEPPTGRVRRDLDAWLERCAKGHLHPPRNRPANGASGIDRIRPEPGEFSPEARVESEASDLAAGLSITLLGAEGSRSAWIGCRFPLELYEGPFREPRRMAAEICRADDVEGFALRFAALTPEEREGPAAWRR